MKTLFLNKFMLEELSEMKKQKFSDIGKATNSELNAYENATELLQIAEQTDKQERIDRLRAKKISAGNGNVAPQRINPNIAVADGIMSPEKRMRIKFAIKDALETDTVVLDEKLQPQYVEFAKKYLKNCKQLEIHNQEILDDMKKDIDGKIYLSAFYNVEKIYLGKEIYHIPENTFRGFVNLREINGGAGVEAIGSGAMYGCRNLAVIECKKTRKVGYSAFTGCDSLGSPEFGEDTVFLNKPIGRKDPLEIAISCEGKSKEQQKQILDYIMHGNAPKSIRIKRNQGQIEEMPEYKKSNEELEKEFDALLAGGDNMDFAQLTQEQGRNEKKTNQNQINMAANMQNHAKTGRNSKFSGTKHKTSRRF